MIVVTEHPTYVVSANQWRQLVKSNTNYTVQVCVVTAFGCGRYSLETQFTSCSTPPSGWHFFPQYFYSEFPWFVVYPDPTWYLSVPNELPPFKLQNMQSPDNSVVLKLDLQRITERHGPIRLAELLLVIEYENTSTDFSKRYIDAIEWYCIKWEHRKMDSRFHHLSKSLHMKRSIKKVLMVLTLLKPLTGKVFMCSFLLLSYWYSILKWVCLICSLKLSQENLRELSVDVDLEKCKLLIVFCCNAEWLGESPSSGLSDLFQLWFILLTLAIMRAT